VNRRTFLAAALSPLVLASRCAGAENKKLDEAIGQMLMVNISGQRAEDSNILEYIKNGRVGGVLLFEANFAPSSSPRETLKKLTSELQSASSTPLLIAMDQEGGAVNRLKQKYGFPATHTAESLGVRNDAEFTADAAENMAAGLAEMGVNLNFSPVVDVKVNPTNPVVGKLGRCFSSEPKIVSNHAAAFIRGHRRQGVLTTLKHFPGHGSSTADSHEGLADVSTTWSDTELLPYKNLIRQNLVDAIMTAHIFNAALDAEHPASLSKATITGLLRNKLGYDGVIISDDLFMGAIKNQYPLEESVALAINAGVDMLLFSTMQDNLVDRVTTIIKQHVASGCITQERIFESAERIKRLKQLLI
jgi:beta-N-acetylhexosaminidase